MQLSINLSFYGSIAFVDFGLFFSFFTQSVGLLGQGISQSQGRYYTQNNMKL
jgi:hypothetical protein